TSNSRHPFGYFLPGLARPTQPLWVFAVADLATVGSSNPVLTHATNRCFHALAFGIAFFVSANHDQERIDQVHRLGLEPFAVVLATVACSDYGYACIDDLRELRLGLNRLGTAQPIQPLDNQKGAT